MSDWQPYDPSWLVELARQQAPEEQWLQDALALCTSAKIEDEQTIYFVDRMTGKFCRNVVLFWPVRGKIVLDLLEDGRIGSLSLFSMAFDDEELVAIDPLAVQK